MIVGGAATIVSLLGLAWVQEIIGGLFGLFAMDSESSGTKTAVIITATILMYCLDFSINTGIKFSSPSFCFAFPSLSVLTCYFIQCKLVFGLSLSIMPQLISRNRQTPGPAG